MSDLGINWSWPNQGWLATFGLSLHRLSFTSNKRSSLACCFFVGSNIQNTINIPNSYFPLLLSHCVNTREDLQMLWISFSIA
jgi:hypothetical protein